MTTRAHIALARMQLMWMCGFITDVGFMRLGQLLLSCVQCIQECYKHYLPFSAAWKRVCSTAAALVQHTSHVLLMTTEIQETATAVATAFSSVHPHVPRGRVHFAYRFETAGEGLYCRWR
jgi:hypothetical protein